MRFAVKLFLPLILITVLAIGLLPPIFARGTLDTDAVDAAKVAAAALSGGGRAGAVAAAQRSIAGDAGVTLVSVKINPGGLPNTVQVTLAETVHTFMDGFPGLKTWFHLTSTQESELGA